MIWPWCWTIHIKPFTERWSREKSKLHQHHHLVCLDCGHIIDLEDPRLNQLPWPDVGESGFQIQDYHVHFRGRCARCRQKPQVFEAGRKSAPSLRIPQHKSKLKSKGKSA